MELIEKKKVEAPGIMLRIKELFFDWLFICGYLLLLLIATLIFYFFIFKGIPKFTNLQSQLISTFTTVVPLIIIFSIMEGTNNFASWGKNKLGLKVIYEGSPIKGSFIRNTLKFLPWQFGHMSTINGIYHDFNTAFSMTFLTLSMLLSIIYLSMGLLGKDKRHLADILARSSVVKN